MFVVCGKEALDAQKVGQLCRDYPGDEVYALPWIRNKEELAKNLKSNGGRPNRLWPCMPNRELMEGEFQGFDESLGSDALGRMARLVAYWPSGRNDIMTSSCPSTFYGKVVSRQGRGDLSFLLSVVAVYKLFPCEPLSAKLYAATTVLVRFRTTEVFVEASGVKSPEVDVLIANDYLPGSVVFMRFYKLVSGKDFVAVDEPVVSRDFKLPVFRYNRGYRSGEVQKDA